MSPFSRAVNSRRNSQRTSATGQVNVWSTNGPEGGSIRSLAIDPQNPAILYAGTTTSGIFKTTNAGETWFSIGDGKLGPYVELLMVDPSDSAVIYAASFAGVFKSTNGGATWTSSNVGLPAGYDVFALLTDRNNSNVLYAALHSAGVFKSLNGGASWTAASSGLSPHPYVPLCGLALDPKNSSTVYAGIAANGSLPGGLFKSTDGGASWNRTGAELNSLCNVSVDPANPDILYGNSSAGVVKTTNGGASWRTLNTGLSPSDYVRQLIIDPQDSNTLYLSVVSWQEPDTQTGIYKSTTGGETWSKASNGLNGAVNSLVVDSTNSRTIYAGTNDHGVFKSVTAADGWSATNRGLNAIWISALASDSANENIIYAGTGQGVFKSSDRGASWQENGFPGKPINALAIDPLNSKILYAGVSGGLFKSVDGGKSWGMKKGLEGADSGFSEIAIGPSDPNTLYAKARLCDDNIQLCSGVIYSSTDQGESWESRVWLGLSSFGPMAIDPKNSSTIYVAFFSDLLKSTDGLKSWSIVHPADTSINTLVVDPNNSNTIYAGTGYQDYQSGEKLNPGVLKSIDGGATWSSIGPLAIVDALAADPKHLNNIYVGTRGSGVFKSTDGGATWSEFNDGLTNRDINGLAIDSSGTHLHASTSTGVFNIQLSAPPPPNPIDDAEFFITQQYRDFLGREPDSIGFQNWVNTLGNCPNGGFGEFENPDCDRVHVSAGFFQSDEFLARGYWILRFGFVGLNRSVGSTRSSMTYAEFVPALQQIGGSNSPAQEEAAKTLYTNAFTQRSDFQALFPASLSNSQYVNGLEVNAGVTLTNKQALIEALNTTSMTRADVLRSVVESQVVFDKFIIPSFVTMEYFGYLRRDADEIGYRNWVDTLTADPNNYRHMIFGFIYSTEYRARFGSP